MALTAGDLQAIQGAIDASAKTTVRTLMDYMDARFEEVDRRFDDVYARFDEIDRRFDDVYLRIDEVYAHVGDVANDVFVTVKTTTDDHERRIARLEHRRAA